MVVGYAFLLAPDFRHFAVTAIACGTLFFRASGEGTVCPISFVKETLYPYSLTHLPHVVHSQWDNPTFEPYKSAFPTSATSTPDSLISHVRSLVASDVKDPALKKLQGLLWREGYVSGEVVTPLFPDVVPVLRAWRQQGQTLAIFSSGSVEAQKLFFKYVGGDEGTEDLNGLFEGRNFDTVNAGGKMESGSYGVIVGGLGKRAGECVFLSDNVREVWAAEKAGLKALVVDRPGNAPLTEEERETLTVVKSLEEVELGEA